MSGRKSPSLNIKPTDPTQVKSRSSKWKAKYEIDYKPDKADHESSTESFAQVMKKHRTIPCEEGAKRFEYYFKPSDYIHNITKVMDFERENNESACAEKHGFPKPRIGRDEDESFDLH